MKKKERKNFLFALFQAVTLRQGNDIVDSRGIKFFFSLDERVLLFFNEYC